MRRLVFLFFGLLLPACSAETGQPAVSFEAVAVAAGEKNFTLDDVSISLDEATVAFGPAYFCASHSGNATLCDTAVGEIRSVTTVDLLQKEPQPLGTYEGLAGTVRSASFDYGIHWFLGESGTHPDANAPSRHSAIIRGTASRAGASVPFEADVDVLPQHQGERAVSTAPADGEISTATTGLEVHLDVASWLADVEFAKAIEAGDKPFLIQSGAPNHNAIVVRMTSGSVPTFVFK